MDRNPTTLEEYFAKLRETPAITSGELQVMVDRPMPRHWHGQLPRGVMSGGVIAFACAMIVGVALLLGGGDGNGKPKRKRTGKVASATATSRAVQREKKKGAAGVAPQTQRGDRPDNLGPLDADTPADTVEASDAPNVRHYDGGTRLKVEIKPDDRATIIRAREHVIPVMSADHDTLVMKDERIEVDVPEDFDNLKYVVPVDSARARSEVKSTRRKPVVRLTSGTNVTPVTINGVRMTELNDDELAQLGVHIRPNGSVVLYSSGSTRSSQYGNAPYQSYAACTFNVKGSRTVAVDRSEIPSGVKPAGFPLYVTDVAGERKLFESVPSAIPLTDAVQSFIDSLDRIELARSYSIHDLIPIRINLRDRVMDASETDFDRPDDLVLWYRPSDNLLGRLPSCMRDELKAELTAVTDALGQGTRAGHGQSHEELAPDMRRIYDSLRARNGERPASCSSAASERAAGIPYLDKWRSRAGAILLTAVAPNPVGDELRFSYRLGASRTVTIDLYDVLGRQERRLLKEASMGKGDHSGRYSLVGIPSGIYLVVITTDRGEQGVQRVVVE